LLLHFLHKENIFEQAGIALTDGDLSEKMYYRVYCTQPFHFDPEDDPKAGTSILMAKLTKDRSER